MLRSAPVNNWYRRGLVCAVCLISLLLATLVPVPRVSGADAAITFLENRVKSDPDSEIRLARLAFVRGQLEREHFTNAIRAAKDLTPLQSSLLAWCCLQLGQLYFGRGDWENAAFNMGDSCRWGETLSSRRIAPRWQSFGLGASTNPE